MKEIILRIYRTHDYDLMMLHVSKMIHIGRAAEQVVIAYYKGNHFRYQIKAEDTYTERLPSQATFLLVFKESEAPGILEWLSGFTDGCRNSFIKNLLRTYLDYPFEAVYRKDLWQSAKRSYSSEPFMPPVLTNRRKRAHKDRWSGTGKENRSRCISSTRSAPSDSRLENSASPTLKSQDEPNFPSPVISDHTTEDMSKPLIDNATVLDDKFDAFSMFNQLRNGE